VKGSAVASLKSFALELLLVKAIDEKVIVAHIRVWIDVMSQARARLIISSRNHTANADVRFGPNSRPQSGPLHQYSPR